MKTFGGLLGGGICLVSFWCAGTLAGHRMGAIIGDPAAFALDFAFVAVFTACPFPDATLDNNNHKMYFIH